MQLLFFKHALGFNGFIETSDEKFMFVFRKKGVSIGEGTYSNSVAASLKTKYALNPSSQFTMAGLENGIIREIEDELGIPPETLLRDKNNILRFVWRFFHCKKIRYFLKYLQFLLVKS